MRDVTLVLVLLALGDSQLGGRLSGSLDLPRTAARDRAEAILVEAGERVGLLGAEVQAS